MKFDEYRHYDKTTLIYMLHMEKIETQQLRKITSVQKLAIQSLRSQLRELREKTGTPTWQYEDKSRRLAAPSPVACAHSPKE